jgi:A/G-specific adenine glycosylase
MDWQAHSPRSKRAVQRALLRWHEANGMHAPWRDSRDPYQALVAAVMAQQTQMSRVLPSYERFIAAFPTLDALASASRADVIRVWAGMGYNQRAVRLHEAARTIVARGWPRAASQLARIDGIGPFTAAIVASFAFGEPAACVDTNVRRVLGRITGDETAAPRAWQAIADGWLAQDDPARWNQALMDYGASVCAARPRCEACVISRWCASRERYAAPTTLVAEERSDYRVARPRGPARPRFEETARYARGRIIDALRALPPGDAIAVEALRRSIGNGSGPIEASIFSGYIDALEAAGLLARRGRGRVALPD